MTQSESLEYFAKHAPTIICKCSRPAPISEFTHSRAGVAKACVRCGGKGVEYVFEKAKSMTVKAKLRRSMVLNVEFIRDSGCDMKGCRDTQGLWVYESNGFSPLSIYLRPKDFQQGVLRCQRHRDNDYSNRRMPGRPEKPWNEDDDAPDLDLVAMSTVVSHSIVEYDRPSIEDLIRKKKESKLAPQDRMPKPITPFAIESDTKPRKTLAPYEGGAYPDIPFTYTHRPCENNECKKVHPIRHYNVYRKRDNQFMFVSKYCEECRMKARKERNDKQNAKVTSKAHMDSMIQWAKMQMRGIECIVCKSVEMEDKVYYDIYTKRRIPFHLKPFLNPNAIVAHTNCMPALRKKLKAMNAIALEEKQMLTNDTQAE